MTTLSLGGEVTREVAALFFEALAATDEADRPLTLDMVDADLSDASVTAMMIDNVRQAAVRHGKLQLISPPQVLAHGLYRIGLLGSAEVIQIVDPRDELPRSP